LKKIYNEAELIYILPPDIEELLKGSKTEEQRAKRILEKNKEGKNGVEPKINLIILWLMKILIKQ
jgi:guanylate kinase